MTDIMNWLKGLALVSVSALCIALTTQTVTVGKHLSRTLMDADVTITKVNATLDKINGKNGTLQQINESVVRVKDLITLSQATLYKQQSSIDKWDYQIGDTLGNLNATLISVKTTSDVTAASEVQVATAATQTIQGVQPVLTSATEEIKDLQTTTQGINAMLPDIQATAKNVNGTTRNLNDTSVEFKQYVHSILHPSWAKRLWGYSVDLAHAVL